MATTSLKIPDELKQRAAQAARQSGVSPHAFMLAAIEQTVQSAERRAGFIAEALAAEREMQESGLGYTANDVHSFIKERIAGINPDLPKAKSWRK